MTIKDIAKECGCGVGTISRVLNNHPDVSDKMRERVLAVVNKYGFVSNQSAKALRAQDSKVIAILIKGTSSILLNALVECIQKRLESLPYNTNVILLDESDNEAVKAYQICQMHRPIGIIFAGGSPEIFIEDFSRIHVPCMVIANHVDNLGLPNLSSVSIDDVAAARRIAEYLVYHGHKNICVIGGDLALAGVSRRRYEGFISVLKKHNIPFNKDTQYVTAKYSLEGGAEATKTLMRQNPSLTAIFTMADVMALGAIRELTDMGRSVPKDVSVTGFDGLDLTRYTCPRLTTVRQVLDQLAERGVYALLDTIERNRPCSHQLVPFEFVAGESVEVAGESRV